MSSPMRWGAPPPRGGGWGGGGGGYYIIGYFIPKPIVWLGVAILIASAGGALLQGFGIPALSYTVLSASKVWNGEIWRLLTWSLLALEPLSLVFSLLALFFFGPDLMGRWGRRRFFTLYFVSGAIVGALTCLVARFLAPLLMPLPMPGVFAVLEMMVIAWAVLFPDRTILLFLVLPIRARHLIPITIFITVLMGIFGSFVMLTPYLIAIALALVYMDVFSFRRAYLRTRMAMLQRDYKRRTSGLRAVDRDKGEEPPRWTH
jgi:membrane associated rhomboid family serine protease